VSGEAGERVVSGRPQAIRRDRAGTRRSLLARKELESIVYG
jgi:hypothetical protein